MILRKGNFNLYGLIITLPYLTLILLLACYFIDKKGSVGTLVSVGGQPNPRFNLNETLSCGSNEKFNHYNHLTVEPAELNISRSSINTNIKRMEKEQRWYFGKATLRGWRVLETKKFIIQSDAIKQDMLTVGFYLEEFNGLLSKFFTNPLDNQRCKIRYFRSESKFREFSKVKGIPTAASFYDPQEKEVVICDVGNVGNPQFVAAIFHEATHQYLDTHLKSNPPPWLSEGMAEYLATAKFDSDSKLTIGRHIPAHIKTLKEAIVADKVIPLKKLTKMTRDDFYNADAKLTYAESWSLVYFFAEGEDLSNNLWLSNALSNDFDWENLEKEWKEHISKCSVE